MIIILRLNGQYDELNRFSPILARSSFNPHHIEQDPAFLNVVRYDANSVMIYGYYNEYQNYKLTGLARFFVGDANTFDQENPSQPGLGSESSDLDDLLENPGNSSSGTRKLIIHPNPARDRVSVSNFTGTNLSFRIVNVLGKEMLSGVCPTTGMSMPTTTMQKGAYYIRFDNGDTQRFVIE